MCLVHVGAVVVGVALGVALGEAVVGTEEVVKEVVVGTEEAVVVGTEEVVVGTAVAAARSIRENKQTNKQTYLYTDFLFVHHICSFLSLLSLSSLSLSLLLLIFVLTLRGRLRDSGWYGQCNNGLYTHKQKVSYSSMSIASVSSSTYCWWQCGLSKERET